MGGGGSERPSNPCIETTTAGARANGHRTYKSGKYDVRWDDAKDGNPAHWHVLNPNEKIDGLPYIDKFGNPTYNRDPNAHMNDDDFARLINQLGGEKC